MRANSLRWKTWSLYARDSFQVTPKLTVNIGVRWEYYPFATTDHAGAKLFNPATGNTLICGVGSSPLDCGVNVGSGAFLPRVGFAYRLGTNTVIHAGYGMSADSNNWRFLRNNWPLVSNTDVGGTANFFPAGSLTGETLAPYPGLTAGIPSVTVPNLSSGLVAVPNNVGPGNTVPFNFRRGYIHSFNVTLQHEIGKLVAEAGYVGNKGVRLLTNENINPAPIGGGQAGRVLFPVASKNWGDVNCLCPDAPSYYNSLQTKVTWRLKGSQSELFTPSRKPLAGGTMKKRARHSGPMAATCFGRTRPIEIVTRPSPASIACTTFPCMESMSCRSAPSKSRPRTGS